MAVTVLVADDEADLLQNISMLLGDLGYEVLTAPDGVIALEMIKEKKPDILLLDIKMPRMSGEQVLSELAALNIKIKVIVSTGHTVTDDQMKDRILKSFKVSAFLEKPSPIEEIDFVIKEVLKEEN